MGDLVHYAEADTIKHVIQAALARGQGEPGAGHIPAGQAADDWLIRQLCAEQFKDGKWVKIKKDNHLLDLAVYNLALARLSLDTGAGAPPPQVDPMAGLAEALQDFSRNRSRARGRVFG
jgi:phage terminase large subunit GpA-like protein